MMFVNLTPHPIHIRVDEEVLAVIEPSSPPARVSVSIEERETIGGVPIVSESFGPIVGLPDPADGVGYIVSRMVAQAAPERSDLYFPAVLVRDQAGRIIGCASLGQIR